MSPSCDMHTVDFFCAKASHQDTHLCGILFDEPKFSYSVLHRFVLYLLWIATYFVGWQNTIILKQYRLKRRREKIWQSMNWSVL